MVWACGPCFDDYLRMVAESHQASGRRTEELQNMDSLTRQLSHNKNSCVDPEKLFREYLVYFSFVYGEQ